MNIQELKNKAIKTDTSISEILREVKIFAKKLKDKKIETWADKELLGYNKKDKIPEYRKISGHPKAFNPYHGWIPWVLNDPEKQQKISQRIVGQPISEIESILNNKSESGFLEMPYPEEIQHQVSNGIINRFTLFISETELVGIVDAIRNKLVDWIISQDDDINIYQSEKEYKDIFPQELIHKLPKDIKILCDDFNFNFVNERPATSMLILRRILPLSIVRFFQSISKETELKTEGEFLETKQLLGKIEAKLSNKRIYNDVMNYKILVDSSQHSYTLNVQMTDTEGAGIKMRIFLEDIFKS
jgi:hypothetical protein